MSLAVVDSVEAALPPAAEGLGLVDLEHPWLGLDSFSEETRQFFHGREEEVGELARRVQRKTLTILFGQSGLGKTSILRAGIVPRLRKEGYCPVYVRIDYSRDSPAPSQQIKQAIFRATEALGKWTRPGSAVPGESLWEFLHHRDDVLMDERGNTLTPLVIFDQFEEIFTLGQMDDFGRARAAEFIEDLADLVENRPPRAIESMLETEDTIVERFDFNRADYRILIALREDYLAHLEALKSSMPSITQNRMRLARMTGQQALAAVVKPGGKLVSEEVAESIVRFVAGGSELRNAEVEPSLLSLVCRELNNARIAQERSEISADLLAGSRDTILNEFYERALTDQPPGVRRFIEDEMLTESGFRESLAEERVQKGFTAADALPGALALLVNRRLLRIEERLDARRVEITHDVLCAVVKASRGERQAREAQEEAERQLAAQREREEATKKSLVRTRWVAMVCAVLAIGAVASAVFGYVSMKRAQEAEAKAAATRTMAQGARAEAEKLLVFLLDDFYFELEPVGRLDIVANLSKRAVDYYASLPPEIRNDETQRNHSLALVRYGYALRNLARIDESQKALGEAVAILEKLYQGGDRSEGTIIGLGLGYAGLARALDQQNKFPEGLAKVTRAEEIMRPAMSGSPSLRMRRAYAITTNYLGFSQMRNRDTEKAIASLQTSRETFRAIDGLKMQDLWSAASYAETTAWLAEALSQAGRRPEARKIGEETIPIASKVLEVRPGDMMAARARALLSVGLADIAADELRMAELLRYARAGESDWARVVKTDPGNNIAWNNLGASQIRVAGALEFLGRLEESLKVWREIATIEQKAPLSPGLARNFIVPTGHLAELEADMGIHRPGQGPQPHHRFAERAVASLPADSPIRTLILAQATIFDAAIPLAAEDYARALEIVRPVIQRVEAAVPPAAGGIRFKHVLLASCYRAESLAAYQLGQYAVAEKAARMGAEHWKGIDARIRWEKFDPDELRLFQGMAIARQGRLDEARKVIEPELQVLRGLVKPGIDDRGVQVLFVHALLASAMAAPGPALARPLLDEANAVLSRLPPEMSRLKSVARLRGWLNVEMAKRS